MLPEQVVNQLVAVVVSRPKSQKVVDDARHATVRDPIVANRDSENDAWF